MIPPYHPDHVERVTFGRRPATLVDIDSCERPAGGYLPDPTVVVAQCSCGFAGEQHLLAVPGAARRLAADLNGHRETYVQAVPA